MSVERRRPGIAIFKTAGINCDQETQYAFETAGGCAEIIHVNQLKSHEKNLEDYQIVVIPGGFSYGDDVASGRIMAIELQTQLRDMLLVHTQHKQRLVVGICNGFQVLVQTGLLPFGELVTLDQTRATLSRNDSDKFESRWIKIAAQESICNFVIPGEPLDLPVAHGEGKFYTDEQTLAHVETAGMVTFRYCTTNALATMDYPDNPNGSLHAIAGICDPSGRIIGLMPHPERYVEKYHHPNWRRNHKGEPDGLRLIKNIVSFAKQL
jgi:phosphoribosylformylglycinamidine synthase